MQSQINNRIMMAIKDPESSLNFQASKDHKQQHFH